MIASFYVTIQWARMHANKYNSTCKYKNIEEVVFLYRDQNN